ncbi:MAG: hypothetical protein H8D42_04225 [Candidatus Marinimicrobia bacterium]|nr:hypothetical protein [Candidatus Neomarinimicrobiota bacterium]
MQIKKDSKVNSIGDIGERLTYPYVEFKDGEKADINSLEYRLISQLI